MADATDEFDKAFENFGTEPKQPESPKVEEQPAAPAPAPAAPEAPKEEPKPNEQPAAEEPKKEEAPAPTGDAPKKEEEPKPAEAPATPPAPETPEAPQPLTEESVKSIIQNIRAEERNTGKELETTTNEVLEAYYPDGLSNTLTTPEGKELKTPADVVAASGGQMNMEEAAQWLMNEQYKLDTEVADIKNKATKIAETTINFKRDSVAALTKYEPLFKAYPMLQEKVFKKLMENVKADTEKGVILQAPDVMGHYDFYLEPYQLAYEHATKQPATNPTPATPAAPAPPTPGVEDRLDEGGDGGASPVDDPSDFGQQVSKELSKGF